MKQVGKTFEDGKMIQIVECPICGWRYKGDVKCENKTCGQTEKLKW